MDVLLLRDEIIIVDDALAFLIVYSQELGKLIFLQRDLKTLQGSGEGFGRDGQGLLCVALTEEVENGTLIHLEPVKELGTKGQRKEEEGDGGKEGGRKGRGGSSVII